jgi:nucleotide-binding universal stress UspA family protein
VIRCVLVATDGSDVAAAAVRTAVDLVLSLGPDARLHAASAIDYAGVPEMLAKRPPGAPDLLAEQAEQALTDAEVLAKDAGVPIQRHLLHGEVVEAVLACAAEIGADILVAGAQGRNRLVRLVVGSVVGRLVRSTELPVVLVHRQLEH